MQYAKQMRGRRVYGGQRHFLPLKVNQAGVMPVIFASACSRPAADRHGVRLDLARATSCAWGAWWYMVFDVALIYFFSFFWTSLMFNPAEMADNIKEYGGFIPGIRPGRHTAEFLERVMFHMTLAGATFLAIIAIVPGLARPPGRTRRAASSHLPRRHLDPDRRERRARPRRQAEQPAADAPLRGLHGRRGREGLEGLMRIVLLGRPGCGKGTQAERLARAGGPRPPLDRRPPARGRGRGHAAGQQAKPLMDAGRLVPDDVVIGLVLRAHRERGAAKGFVLDGFPRTSRRPTRSTARWGRRASSSSSTTCSTTRTIVRARSAAAAPTTRSPWSASASRVYRAQTEPLVARYRGAGLLREVDASGSIDEVEPA